MEKVKLPKSVRAALEAQGVASEAVLRASATDMNTSCEYADGYIILTAGSLCLLTSPPCPGRVRSFRLRDEKRCRRGSAAGMGCQTSASQRGSGIKNRASGRLRTFNRQQR